MRRTSVATLSVSACAAMLGLRAPARRAACRPGREVGQVRGVRHRTAGVDVLLPLQIAALDASNEQGSGPTGSPGKEPKSGYAASDLTSRVDVKRSLRIVAEEAAVGR